MCNLLRINLFLILFLPNTGFCKSLDYEKINQFVDEMVNKHDFDTNELRILFGGEQYSGSVLQAMSRPAESLAWYKYRSIFLNEARIKRGVTFWEKHKETLNIVMLCLQ